VKSKLIDLRIIAWNLSKVHGSERHLVDLRLQLSTKSVKLILFLLVALVLAI